MKDARTYDHLLGFALEHPWALTRPMLATIAGILARRVAGEETPAGEIEAALVNRKALPQPQKGGAVALIPVYGVIAPRMNLLSEMSGGTTFEQLSAQLQAALDNPEVKTVVFDVDSPGGNVAGATEFAREVMKARTQKAIIAQVQHLGASAAYWAMAGATEIVASPSSMVGSIGVYTIHDDVSEALGKLGVKREVFAAGKYKAEGADGGPLTDDAKAHIKGLVDTTYARMVTDIGNGRGVKAPVVRAGYGEGRCLDAEAALAAGMIDRIATLSDTLARVLRPPARSDATTAAHATDQEPPRAATSQERAHDALWQTTIAAALLELELF